MKKYLVLIILCVIVLAGVVGLIFVGGGKKDPEPVVYEEVDISEPGQKIDRQTNDPSIDEQLSLDINEATIQKNINGHDLIEKHSEIQVSYIDAPKGEYLIPDGSLGAVSCENGVCNVEVIRNEVSVYDVLKEGANVYFDVMREDINVKNGVIEKIYEDHCDVVMSDSSKVSVDINDFLNGKVLIAYGG